MEIIIHENFIYKNRFFNFSNNKLATTLCINAMETLSRTRKNLPNYILFFMICKNQKRSKYIFPNKKASYENDENDVI